MLARDGGDEEQADDLVLAEEALLEEARELREARGERLMGELSAARPPWSVEASMAR